MGSKAKGEGPFAKSLRSLRASSGPPPASDGKPLDTYALLARFEQRQAEVVCVIGDALETVGEVVQELRVSVAEDERVRKEVRALGVEVRQLRSNVRVALYTCVVLVAVAVGVSVYSSVQQVRVAADARQRVAVALDRLNGIDSNAARTLQVMLKQADAHAKSVEAEAALTPQAEQEALEAAIDVQEQAAEASIEVAKQRKQAPPPEAKAALEKARAKRAAYHGQSYDFVQR